MLSTKLTNMTLCATALTFGSKQQKNCESCSKLGVRISFVAPNNNTLCMHLKMRCHTELIKAIWWIVISHCHCEIPLRNITVCLVLGTSIITRAFGNRSRCASHTLCNNNIVTLIRSCAWIRMGVIYWSL